MQSDVILVEKDFLLKATIEQKKTVRVHALGFSCPGILLPIQREFLGLQLQQNESVMPSLFEHLTIYFDFSKVTYAFDTVVRKLESNTIKLDIPKRLRRSLKRKYIRVKTPRDVKTIFHLANEEIKLDYPVCDEYSSISQTIASSEYDIRNLNTLIQSFKKKIAPQSTEDKVIMFRTRQPETLEETIITKTGKVLYIPSTSSPLPKHDPYPEGRIVTEEIEETFEKPDYFIEGSEFEKKLKEKQENGINSEIWCPIVFYQYVVGYIYVANTGREAVSLDINMVDYTLEFSRVLAYFLNKTGYFKTDNEKPEPLKHAAKIIDMTPEGMLMALPQNEIKAPIKEGTIFSMQISLKDKHISCSGKVMRRYVQADTVCYGISFMNLSPEEVIKLHEYLYHRPYSEGDIFTKEILSLTGFEDIQQHT